MVTGSIGDKNTVNIIIEAAIKTKSLFQKNSMWTPPEPPDFTAVTGLL